MEEEELVWNRETVPRVFKIVSTKLHQRDLISLLIVSPWLHRSLISYPSLWLVLDFRELNNAGDRLVSALSLCSDSLQNLESLNLNGCQKISDKGIEAITTVCFNLKVFSIYWNVRVSDIGIKHLVKNCKRIVNLNLSGCKNITDKSLQLLADNYQYLESLNLTRCIKITDGGLCQILLKCSSLQSLNLYALSSFTDEAYKKISILANLRFLDLCGSQNLTNEGLYCIAKCKNLASLNLTWCVRVTDEGVIAIAQGCISLEFLSLFGIIGVTDKCLEALSRFCSNTLTTLDVNGCIGIKRRSHEELLQLFPHLRCFKVHS
ncbi:F-box protein At3g58530 isoform X3 [Camellia sinensis]|uniref:F-box protein At3g58530 isoform X3 n=1 Tax=Camellia sinensis TaxID=4442 RepID=UPI0010356047|nr:F-box protein At3g58530 isoform X3 [Camellia sinensis]